MTEQDIIKLGFNRVDVTAGENGYPKGRYYYTYDFTQGLRLISCDNEEAKNSGWYVEIFEADDIKFKTAKDLEELIEYYL
jgi:hypothetical protein